MKTTLLPLAVLLASVCAAGAQGVSGSDVMGIFFDREANANAYATAAGYEAVPAFLCLVNPSESGGVAAFECEISVEGDPMTIMWQPVANAVNVAAPPQYFAAFFEPFPQGSVVVLAECTALVPSAADAARFYVGHYRDDPGLEEELPVYIPGVNKDLMIYCEVSSGSPNIPCALINDLPPNENANWGALKLLFRD